MYFWGRFEWILFFFLLVLMWYLAGVQGVILYTGLFILFYLGDLVEWSCLKVKPQIRGGMLCSSFYWPGFLLEDYKDLLVGCSMHLVFLLGFMTYFWRYFAGIRISLDSEDGITVVLLLFIFRLAPFYGSVSHRFITLLLRFYRVGRDLLVLQGILGVVWISILLLIGVEYGSPIVNFVGIFCLVSSLSKLFCALFSNALSSKQTGKSLFLRINRKAFRCFSGRHFDLSEECSLRALEESLTGSTHENLFFFTGGEIQYGTVGILFLRLPNKIRRLKKATLRHPSDILCFIDLYARVYSSDLSLKQIGVKLAGNGDEKWERIALVTQEHNFLLVDRSLIALLYDELRVC